MDHVQINKILEDVDKVFNKKTETTELPAVKERMPLMHRGVFNAAFGFIVGIGYGESMLALASMQVNAYFIVLFVSALAPVSMTFLIVGIGQINESRKSKTSEAVATAVKNSAVKNST